MSNPAPNSNVPQIPQPLADVGALVSVAQQLKQGVDSLAGHRGNVLDRAVTFNDLINLGLVATGGATSAASSPTDLKMEAAARIAGDDGLGSRITAETARAEAAETALSAEIAAELSDVGTVQRVVAGPGLAGGAITTVGTISLGFIPPGSVLGNAGTSGAIPSAVEVGTGLALSASTLIATARSAVLPLVNGDIPGPGIISDPNGQCVGVPI